MKKSILTFIFSELVDFKTVSEEKKNRSSLYQYIIGGIYRTHYQHSFMHTNSLPFYTVLAWKFSCYLLPDHFVQCSPFVSIYLHFLPFTSLLWNAAASAEWVVNITLSDWLSELNTLISLVNGDELVIFMAQHYYIQMMSSVTEENNFWIFITPSTVEQCSRYIL